MRNSIFGRIQFLSIIAVFILPLFMGVTRSSFVNASISTMPADPVIVDNDEVRNLPFQTVPNQSESFLKLRELNVRNQNVDCTIENCLALTFDDGPNRQVTSQVLDVLESYKARASFFVIGSRVASHQDIMQRIYKEGHDVGNHTWSHPMLNKISPEQIAQEFNVTQQAIVQSGIPAPTLFRPPYGIRTPVALATIQAPFILWNIDPQDWLQKDVNALTQHVLSHAKRGAVVVLHDTSLSTVETLKRVIPELQKNYTLVTITDMFDLKPESRGQYFGLQ